MKTEILVIEYNEPFEVRESYALIKKRLLDSLDFIEVTVKKGDKRLIAKSSISLVEAIEQMGKSVKKVEKN